MRNWILGGFLACFTTAGIAYVLAKNSADSHCGPCIEKPVSTDARTPILPPMGGGFERATETCPHCERKADGSSKVVDVVDLDRTFLLADGTRPQVSFEEPPLAKPRGEVTRVVFETPIIPIVSVDLEFETMPREVAPMPREVK